MALDLKDDPELIARYEHYHHPENIWPEIPVGIREAGIVDMQIYRIGSRLFMILDGGENIDFTAAFKKMGELPRQDEWAALMLGFQVRLSEAHPEEHWATMKPVFLLNDNVRND
jgi:L-rhamnose mutarotase